MALILGTGACTLTGLRQENEDTVAVLHFGGWALGLVADGRGGGGAGRLASRTAAEAIGRQLALNLAAVRSAGMAGAAARHAVLQAHRDLASAWAAGPARGASTVVLALWPPGGGPVHVASVGNSRAYLLRGQRLKRVSEHPEEELRAQLGERVCGGPLLPLLGYVGDEPPVRVKPVHIQAGDRLLLCSDGLWQWLDGGDLLGLLNGQPCTPAAAGAACEEALRRGSRDNVSAVVCDAVELTAPVGPAAVGWRGGLPGQLAQAIRDHDQFSDLPVLADALEEAGCVDRAVLDHCRGPGPHARGCWVVDLVLGKA